MDEVNIVCERMETGEMDGTDMCQLRAGGGGTEKQRNRMISCSNCVNSAAAGRLRRL